MRINKIQQHNTINTRFKALRLTKKSSNYIFCAHNKAIDKLDEIGENLLNTKFFHLEITDKAYFIRHLSNEKFYPPFLVRQMNKYILISGKTGIDKETRKVEFENVAAAEDALKKIHAADSQIERTAILVKYLDDNEKQILSKESIINIDPKMTKEEKLKLLIKKYGI